MPLIVLNPKDQLICSESRGCFLAAGFLLRVRKKQTKKKQKKSLKSVTKTKLKASVCLTCEAAPLPKKDDKITIEVTFLYL